MTLPSGHSPDEAVRDPDEEARKALTLFERQLEANQPMIRGTIVGRRVQKSRVFSKG